MPYGFNAIRKPSTKQEFEFWMYQAGLYFSVDGERVHHAVCQLSRRFGDEKTLGEIFDLVYSSQITEDEIRAFLDRCV